MGSFAIQDINAPQLRTSHMDLHPPTYVQLKK